MSRANRAALLGIMLAATSCAGDKPGPEPLSKTREATFGVCTSANLASGFFGASFDQQAGSFTISFDATPSVAPTDALLGVALGAADSYGDLAAIVRFNPSGFIDARNGASYQALASMPYSAGVTRHIFLEIDLVARTYSVFVDNEPLARDFSFRTEQKGVLALDTLVLKVDDGESLSACNLTVQTTRHCESVAPNQGFVNTGLPPASPAFTVNFAGVPRAANMDGVMGISTAAAASFPALAGAVRFNPSGTIDALNGASYAPIGAGAYAPNTSYSFTIIADSVDHTYSVLGPRSATITRNLSFRPQQSGVSSLGNFAKVSDSEAGALTVCDLGGSGALGAAWIHDGSRYGDGGFSLAVSNDRLLLSDASRTLVLDSLGRVTRELPYGGSSVADPQGNLYLLGKFNGSYDGGTGVVLPTTEGGNIYVSKYDADFNPIYTRVVGTSPDVTFSSPSADGQGNVAFVLRGDSSSSAVKLDANGTVAWSSEHPVTAIALDASGQMLLGYSGTSSITMSKLDAFGQVLFSRTFATQGVSLRGVVFDSLGDSGFWGEINGQIDFGGNVFRATSSEIGNQGLLGVLNPDGSPRYIHTTSMHSTRRAVADSAGHLFVVGTHANPDGWQLDCFDDSGSRTATRSGDELLGGLFLGISGDVAVDSARHVYWQFFPRYVGLGLNYLAQLQPF